VLPATRGYCGEAFPPLERLAAEAHIMKDSDRLDLVESRVRQLESEVRELHDLRDIQNLRFRYHIAVNEGLVEDIPALFCDDGEADFGEIGAARGRTEIAAFYREVVGGSPFIKQFIHNHAIEIKGDTATGRSYLEAKTVANGESLLVAARFDDEYARTAAGWLFRSLRLTPFFVTPLAVGWAPQDAADDR
jgi:hypothetical protein